MEMIEIPCYSDAVNFVVLKTPGRSFPGSVIQGDSLGILCRSAERALAHFDKGELADAREYLDDVVESLRERLAHYREVLTSHGLKLP